jgi:two-component system phosphate regulon sensor histidine kinase PhoR
MKNSIILIVFVTGVLSVVGTLAIQTYWIFSTWDINDKEFKQKAHFALNNVAEGIAEFKDITLPSHDVVTQQTSNYFIVNIEAEIDSNILEFFLRREFERSNLKIDFEYAIFDCNTDQMVYGDFLKYSPGEKIKVSLGDLPTYEGLNYYFGVKFPTLPGYLLGKMQLSLFFSGILLLTILFFTYAMFVILRQKRLSDLQKDFINNMTHEFKTPLSTIKISADVFLSSPEVQSSPRLQQYAQIIKDQNQRLNNQVEKVLQLAKVEKGLKLKKGKVRLDEIIQSVSNAAGLAVQEKNGNLSLRLPEYPIWVYADKLHLTNIVYSLVDNAVKYCKDVPAISISVKKESKQWICLSIQDQGIGIPKEYQNRVFEKFFRIPTGNVHNVKGFGLGLFYVKKICDAHGWKLKLESEEGKGTSIHIRMYQVSGL